MYVKGRHSLAKTTEQSFSVPLFHPLARESQLSYMASRNPGSDALSILTEGQGEMMKREGKSVKRPLCLCVCLQVWALP